MWKGEPAQESLIAGGALGSPREACWALLGPPGVAWDGRGPPETARSILKLAGRANMRQLEANLGPTGRQFGASRSQHERTWANLGSTWR